MIGLPDNLIKGLEPVKAAFGVAKDVTKFDVNYVNPKHWKYNDFGFLTNTWITFYIERSAIEKLITDETNKYKEVTNSINMVFTAGSYMLSFLTDILNETEAQKYVSVTIHNISINMAKSPIIITKNVIGSATTVKQFFASNDWDITITGLISGSTSYSQDSKTIGLLWKIFEVGIPVKVSNPELDIVYGVNQIVPYNYNFDQYENNYHLKQFTLSCKSDSEIKIIM